MGKSKFTGQIFATSNSRGVARPSGPTVDGIKPLLRASDSDKTKILKNTQKDWKELIRLHFDAESGIGGNDGSGFFGKWKPLSERHVDFKERNDLLPGILESSSPNLMERYQRSIRFSTDPFGITIEFPVLITGTGYGKLINAGIHQGDSKEANPLGYIKRRIIKKNFIASGQKRLLEYFTK